MIKIANKFLYNHTIIILSLIIGAAQYTKAATQWSVKVAGNLTSVGLLTPTGAAQNSSAGNPNGKASYWSFAGTAGVTYYFSFSTSTSTEDIVMSVYDGLYTSGTSALVASNDDNGASIKSAMTFVCPATQTYYILADNSNSISPFTFTGTGTIVLTYYFCAAVAATSPPLTENWNGASVINTACTSWMAQGGGAEGDWWINKSASPIAPWSTANLAGGTNNELIFTGSQANIFGIGVVKNLSIISAPINTTGILTMPYSFKHTLELSSNTIANGTSGSDVVTIKLQSSGDLISWTDQWSGTYTCSSAGAIYGVFKTTTNVNISIGPNLTTYLRFYISAVPFKIDYWAIDDGITGVIVLPIELELFAAKLFKNGTKVEWTTASETNNNYFTVERSNDAENYVPIKTVKGAGSSHTTLNYSIIDEQPIVGVNYYRLKQTDYNGNYKYSDMVSVIYERKDAWFCNLLPNPASNDISFNLYSPLKTSARVQVIDIAGRVIIETQEDVMEGVHSRF